MKKLTLFLVATLFSALSFAALNPYAYGLSSSLDGTTLKVNYSLNADATGVSVVILDGAEEVKTVTCDGITKGSHSVEISTLDLPTGKSLTWKVEVKGAVVAKATAVKTYRFFHPSGIDVDNNPESLHFGRILCLEANHSVKTTTSTSGYLGKGYGAGIYAFDPAFEPILNGTNPGFNGNNPFVHKDKHHYPVRRIRISDDGRIFVTAQNDGGCFLWEIDPDNLNSWTKVFKGTEGTYTTTTADGKFIAGTNSGFDVHGSGENLKLVMLSAGKSGGNVSTFRCDEYDLGTRTEWSTIPSRSLNKGYHYVTNQSNVQYDAEGGIWHIQYRGNVEETHPGLVHINKDGVEDFKEYWTNARNAGFCFNKDYSKVIIAGKFNDSHVGTQKYATIYTVSKNSEGKPTLTKELEIDMTNIGAALNDFAWDWADNIYAVDNNGEYLCAYALPHDADKVVSTPCASKYAFVIPPQLNPFAYKLSSELSADEKNLTIKYSLNANATSVNWVLLDGDNVVKTVDLSSLGLEKGDYTTTISTTDFPQYKALTWKIEVKGVAVDEVTAVKGESFYRPFGVDIDNNPENPHFGRILCGETYTSSDTKYASCGVGSGIYEYSPAFELIPNGTRPGYNGGKTFTEHSPYRIRISEDGRIFVTAHDQAGEFLWEVNPDNLNEWTSVFQGATHNTSKLLDASGKFIAGTNAGFDVRGTGENLQLLMLSCDNLGTNTAEFQCHEYNIGTAKTWNKVPSKAISDIQLHNSMIARYSQVIYDKDGGFWEIYYINTSLLGGIAHFAKQADGSYVKEYVKNKIMLRAGGCAFNHDFSKLILCGDVDVTTNSPGSAVIYSVSKDADGKPVLTKETTINTAVVGGNLNDFAWDYANNIYVVGNNGELLQVYALPHSSDDVVATPAASKYTFSIGKYTMIANTNDVNKGIVSGAGEYLPGATATLTATPEEGYELLYWSDRSTENPRTITMNKNEALSAYFIKKNDVEPTFSITKVWENTNVPDVNTNGYQAVGWDGKVYLQASADSKIMVYNGTSAATEYATSGAGYQIAVDEAGNMIVFNGYFATATPGNVLIYKKGSTTGKTVTFTLPNPGRCDFFSASGDIYSAEGGYVYFYCNTQTVVNRVKITNGAATDADVTIDVVGENLVTGCTQNHVVVDIFGNLLAQSRLNGVRAVNVYTDEAKSFFLPEHKTNTLGGCSFELGGKEFWAYNVGTKAYTSEWKLYNITDKTFLSESTLYAKNTTETNKNQAANWLNVQVVGEKTAYIYQYCPTVAVAVWKVTRDHIVSATAENGSVTGTGTYKDNETATLTATPNDGYRFKNWTKNGEVKSTENPYSFTVTEDVELVANFDGPFCELILNTNDEAKGTVSGAGFYIVGQTVTIEAIPQAGYKLLYWSDRSTENPRNITIDGNEALSAYFVKIYDEEPTFTITKVWENLDAPASTNNGYQAVGWDGKIYLKDRGNDVINVYSDATTSATYASTDSKDDQSIAVDDAGNLVLRSGSTNFYDAPKQVILYKKGETTYKTIDFTLPASGRCDFISASGDLFSAEGGYVYFYCQNQTTVSRLHVKNGGATAADIVVDAVGAGITGGNTQSHVMVDIFGNLVTHSRTAAINKTINAYTGEATTFTLPNDQKAIALGGCSFELGGKEFWAYNVKGSNICNTEWNLYNMTDKKCLSDETLYLENKTDKNSAANWLNVQVIDENTVYIYQFCPTVAMAVWKVTCVTEKTVTIDEDAVNTTALEDYDGDKVTATVKRNFAANKYLTLTLPFNMSATQIRNVFGNATVYALYNVFEYNAEEVHLQFSPVSTIKAGAPYILATATSGYDAEDGFTIEGVEIDLSLKPVTPASGDVTMVPVLDAGGTLNQSDEYFLSNNALYCAETYPRDIMGLRAYFESTSPLPIRARVVFQDNEATSIPMVETQPANQVRKVLKDGQLLIIRGEEMYNIQGQRME